MRRTLTWTIVAAGGLVLAGAALQALARNGDRPAGPLLSPTEPQVRRTGAPRPVRVSVPERSTPMSTRFVSNMLLALAGGFVIVATQAFSPPVVAWIAFAVTSRSGPSASNDWCGIPSPIRNARTSSGENAGPSNAPFI